MVELEALHLPCGTGTLSTGLGTEVALGWAIGKRLVGQKVESMQESGNGVPKEISSRTRGARQIRGVGAVGTPRNATLGIDIWSIVIEVTEAGVYFVIFKLVLASDRVISKLNRTARPQEFRSMVDVLVAPILSFVDYQEFWCAR